LRSLRMSEEVPRVRLSSPRRGHAEHDRLARAAAAARKEAERAATASRKEAERAPVPPERNGNGHGKGEKQRQRRLSQVNIGRHDSSMLAGGGDAHPSRVNLSLSRKRRMD